jgi:hypothetical protein
VLELCDPAREPPGGVVSFYDWRKTR